MFCALRISVNESFVFDDVIFTTINMSNKRSIVFQRVPEEAPTDMLFRFDRLASQDYIILYIAIE